MKRDMDLLRQLMLAAEETEETHLFASEIELPDDPPVAAVVYHARLLDDAGLIDGTDASTHDGQEYLIRRLTWHGHEFLDAARSDTIWSRVKRTLAENGGDAPFAVVQQLVVRAAENHFLG